MARQRFDTAPQFNVAEESVVIQQVVGSTAPMLELKDHSGNSMMTISNAGVMTTSVTPSFTDISVSGNATISGNLTVNGNTITLNSEIVNIKDKNIVLANVIGASNSTADGAGITVDAGPGIAKTFNFVNFTSSWTSSEHIDLAANKAFKVNNIDVMCPVGMVSPFAGNTAPSGWLLCSGQAVSRTTYSALYNIIGNTYGSGDGVTTFNLPDLRGRIVAGEDDMGGNTAGRITSANSGITGTTLGATGGNENLHQHQHTNTLTNNAVTSGNQSADHSHSGTTGNDNTEHTHSGTTGNDSPDHTHSSSTSPSGPHQEYIIRGQGNDGSAALRATTGASARHQHSFTTGGRSAFHQHAFTSGGVSVNHTHSVTSNVSITNANTGSGTSQNVQPTIILNYIIKH